MHTFRKIESAGLVMASVAAFTTGCGSNESAELAPTTAPQEHGDIFTERNSSEFFNGELPAYEGLDATAALVDESNAELLITSDEKVGRIIIKIVCNQDDSGVVTVDNTNPIEGFHGKSKITVDFDGSDNEMCNEGKIQKDGVIDYLEK